MKTPVTLPAAGFRNLQKPAITFEKIYAHPESMLVTYRLDKMKSITSHGNILFYKVGDQVMEE